MSCRPLVAALARQGVPTPIIAARAGVSTARVCLLRRELGLAAPTGRPGPRIDREEVARLHAHGLSDREIGRRIGFSNAGVSRVRRLIQLPSQGVPGPKPTLRAPAVRRIAGLEAVAWDVLPIAAKIVARRCPELELDELVSLGALWVRRMSELAPAQVRNPRVYAVVALRSWIWSEAKKALRWRARLAPQAREGAA